MAISAFYIHKRSVDQVLHRLTTLRRKSSKDKSIVSDEDVYKFAEYRKGIEADESRMEWFRVSSSVPNLGLPNDWLNQESVQAISNSVDDHLNLIPSGLQPLRTDQTDGIHTHTH